MQLRGHFGHMFDCYLGAFRKAFGCQTRLLAADGTRQEGLE